MRTPGFAWHAWDDSLAPDLESVNYLQHLLEPVEEADEPGLGD